MLGKKLYSLITELDTSARKLIYYRSQQSEDKRLKQLALILGKKNSSIEEFNDNLLKVKNALVVKGSSDKVKGDALRRFADFAANEIENIKISIFVKENKKIRAYILSEIYKEVEPRDLQEEYLQKLKGQLDGVTDFWMTDYYLVQQSALKLRSQTTKDTEDWRNLLLEQKNLAQSFYLRKNSTILDKISSLYLDDKSSIERIGKDLADEKQILSLIAQSDSPPVKSVFYLALAQFNFEKETKFNEYSILSLRAIEGLNDRASDNIRRKMELIKFLHAFHFGCSAHEVLEAIEQVVDIDSKYKLREERAIFFLFLSQLIFNEKEGALNYFKGDSKKYFNLKSADYFYKFLKAIEHFRNNELKLAKGILMDVSYSKNPYVASWSRQLEMVINLKQGNEDLVNSYLLSECKRLKANENRIFTLNSSAFLLCEISNHLSAKIPGFLKKLSAEEKMLSPFHTLLYNYIKK